MIFLQPKLWKSLVKLQDAHKRVLTPYQVDLPVWNFPRLVVLLSEAPDLNSCHPCVVPVLVQTLHFSLPFKRKVAEHREHATERAHQSCSDFSANSWFIIIVLVKLCWWLIASSWLEYDRRWLEYHCLRWLKRHRLILQGRWLVAH